ncbi:MAG TPA: hypothetical protein VFF69_00755 [Phycisphaerales bacterium]|nr:hypothetical protein [Phycisphaerales bacterium]
MTLAQPSTHSQPPRTGSDIASWAGSPEKLALVWIVGGALLVGVVALLVKMKMDKD